MKHAICTIQSLENLFPGVIRVSNTSNASMIICQRASVRDLLRRNAALLEFSGVYLLRGLTEAGPGVYIGQSTNFVTRLRQHDDENPEANPKKFDWSEDLSAYLSF
jgi:hypothetical protein